MTFKPAIWYPIAVALSVINVGAIAFTAGPAQPLHATAHGALAVAFGLWAHRLRQRRGASEPQDRLDVLDVLDALDALDAEVNKLRLEVSELHERLDFAERLLAQRPEPRVGPQR
jgi:hypothetical protein